MANEKSLFYLVSINSHQSMINKKQIESAKQKSENEVEFTMITGDKFIGVCQFGDLMFHLFQVQHTPDYPD